jgi:hypothetical protein
MKKGKHVYSGFDWHNPSDRRVYFIWFDMRRRCNDPKNKRYEQYGGRGIKVCEDWNSFQNFFDWSKENGYADDLTIDRIDRDGNYEQSNCRWADSVVQANNRSNNHYITYKGKTLTMMEWARALGINYSALRSRINSYGMDIETAFTRPVGRWLK